MEAKRSSTGPGRAIVAAVLLLAAPLLGLPAPSEAGHIPMDVVHREQVDGSGAFGIAADLDEDGALGVTLTGEADGTSTPLSGGVVFFDEQGDYEWMIAITLHRSPDRLVVSPSPAEPEPTSSPADEGVWQVQTRGEGAGLAQADVTFSLEPADGEAGAGEDAAPAQLRFGVATQIPDADEGTNQVGIWLGEVSSSTLEVATNVSAGDVRTHAGTGHVAGDLDLEEDTVDVQAQRTPVDASLLLDDAQTTVGAKVLHDLSTTVEVRDGLYGFWAHHEWKEACAGVPALLVCPDTELVYDACRSATGVDCGKASLSWEGPGDGGSLANPYIFEGAPPGEYTFTVDHKVDLYGPEYRHGDTGNGLKLDEHHSYLTIGDFRLPS